MSNYWRSISLASLRRLFANRSPEKRASPPVDRPASVPPSGFNALMTVEPWGIGEVSIADDSVEIRGWAIVPKSGHGSVAFAVNGQIFEQITYPTSAPWPDIERLFWYRPYARQAGFHCVTRLAPEQQFPEGKMTLAYVWREPEGQPLYARHIYYFNDVTTDTQPFPDPVRRTRVHGSDEEKAFRLIGFDTFVKLELALEEFFGRTYADFEQILDWGCGCGRLARHFSGLPNGTVTGADIDRDNAEWCADNLPFGTFQPLPLRPPTSLPPAAFDLLIGISVFTHLAEQEQLAWLAELQRIAQPGAILLMTTHGETSICRSGLDENYLDPWQARGFLDVGQNLDLAGAIPEDDYYRNVFHTEGYIRRVWSDYFEIVAIVPGYIGNVHDLVIMRRRANEPMEEQQ